MEVVVSYPTCPGFSTILLRYQNTSTRMNTDSHAGRAVHPEKKMLGGCTRKWGIVSPLSWHKMQALPCRMCGFEDSARPFIIALLFLSLAGLLDRAEAPGADRTSITASGPQDFNTFVFSAISVK